MSNLERVPEDNQLTVPPEGRLATAPLQTITVPPPGERDATHPSFLQVLWRRKLIILVMLLVGAGGGYAFIRTSTPIYRSSARLYVQANNPKIMANEDTGAAKSNLNTECTVIGSGPILSAVLEDPVIKSLRTFGGPSAVTALSEGLSVSVGKNDDIITVSFETPYKEDAPLVVKAVVDAYINYQSSRKKDSAGEVRTILENEKFRRDADLEEGLKALLDFKQKHPELGMQGDKGNIIVQRLERLSTALTEAELEVVEATGLRDAVMAMKDDPAKIRQFFDNRRSAGGIYINTQDEDAKLQADLANLELQLREIKRHFTANASNPAVQEVEERIKAVKEQIAKRDVAIVQRNVAAVEEQYRAATQKSAQLQDAYNKQIAQATGLNQVAADYTKLQSKYEQTRKMVDLLDSRIKEMKVTENVRAMNINRLETASMPGSPVKPDVTRAMGISVALGLLLGVALAFLRERMNPRLSSPEQVSAVLGVPVVGVLPLLKGKGDAKTKGQGILQFPFSQSAEAVRSIRTAITFGMPGGVRSILVTSPGPGDGKSTLVSNLGIAMAQAGQKTLIIDADFRQPQQHNIFGLASDVGLSDMLKNGQDIQKYILKSGVVDGLDIIVTGLIPSHPSEVLNNAKFPQMIQKLSALYDMILLDSPPMMAVTDSLVLAALSDLTLLVVRSEKTDRRMAAGTRESLAGVGARVFGAVVNGLPARKGKYAMRYYHGYGYGYGQTAATTTEIVKADQS